MMVTRRTEPNTMLEILLDYFKKTKPALLILHLIYIMVVSITLSMSYVLAFHWTAVIQIYADAHDVRLFGTNLKNSVENDAKLNNILHAMIAESGGIRSYIYRYHNGLAAINSVPFFFQSNTHEAIAPGVSRLMAYEQRIPASFSVSINNQYVKNQCATIANADVDKDSQNYYYYQARTAKAFIRCPIYMENGDLFGFVGIDFLSNPTDMKKATAQTADAAKKIGDIFAMSKK